MMCRLAYSLVFLVVNRKSMRVCPSVRPALRPSVNKKAIRDHTRAFRRDKLTDVLFFLFARLNCFTDSCNVSLRDAFFCQIDLVPTISVSTVTNYFSS